MNEPSLEDIDPFNAVSFRREAEFTQRRFEYLIQRRDTLLDRIRFGALAINAASLVALGSILAGNGQAAAWIGFNPARARLSAGCFIFGTVTAVLSIWLEGVRSRSEPADANAKRLSAASLTALYATTASKENRASVREAMDKHHALPLVDFQFSRLAISAEGIAGGAWVAGAIVPLWQLLF